MIVREGQSVLDVDRNMQNLTLASGDGYRVQFGPTSRVLIVMSEQGIWNEDVPSIPDAPSPMVRYRLSSFFFFLFCQIVEKEVNQDSIDLRVRLQLENLAT